MSVLFDDHLLSFRQLHDFSLIKVFLFIGKEMFQVRFYVVINSKIFYHSNHFASNEINGILMASYLVNMVNVVIHPIQASTIFVKWPNLYVAFHYHGEKQYLSDWPVLVASALYTPCHNYSYSKKTLFCKLLNNFIAYY